MYYVDQRLTRQPTNVKLMNRRSRQYRTAAKPTDKAAIKDLYYTGSTGRRVIVGKVFSGNPEGGRQSHTITFNVDRVGQAAERTFDSPGAKPRLTMSRRGMRIDYPHG
jgi:hypothetical protein